MATHSEGQISVLPIVRALAHASAAGIPTIKFTKGTITVNSPGLDRTNLLVWLETLIGGDEIWNRLGAESRPSASKILPVALVHLCDGMLPDGNLIVPIPFDPDSTAAVALRDSLFDPLFERLSILRDVEPAAALEVAIMPGHSTWLDLGATMYFAKSRIDSISGSSGVRLADSGGFEVTNSQTVDALMQELSSLWPCSFDATFVDFEDTVRLSGVSIGEKGAQENSSLLAQHVSASDVPTAKSDLLLANAAVRLPAEHRPAYSPVCRGQSQGERCASGPLATSIVEAAEFAAKGVRPILVLRSLLPTAASGLEQCAGLILEREGLASHIAILARSLGLAVVTRVEGLRSDDASSVLLGSDVVRSGEIISVNESDGGVYRGALLPIESSIMSIATWINNQGKNPVAIAASVSSPKLPTRCVGLCRSEMQILGSSVAHQFKKYLARAISSVEPEPIPEKIKVHLQNCLAELLAASKGEITNYRLIDADVTEVLFGQYGGVSELDFDIEPSPNLHDTIRGPRWALATGFYDWQLWMAISSAVAAAREGQVDLIITLPSAFSLAEVRAVRAMFDRHLGQHPEARSLVRFGVMLETPRLCASPSPLAEIADVFSFGLNDLTSAAYGLGRDAWATLDRYYTAAGLEEQDPFANLDRIGVGALVSRTLQKLIDVGVKGPFFLCGEPAASSAAHNQFAGQGNLFFSVAESDWARASMSCGRVMARRKGSVVFERTPVDDHSAATIRQVIAARAVGRDACAQEAALRWFASVFPLQPFPRSQNWKVLKKLLVYYLFGELEGRFFPTPWSIEEVARYIRSLDDPDRATRISAFPSHISCHARSEIVSRNLTQAELLAFVSSFDPNTTLNVFPQQNPDQMCFRLVFNETGIAFEAGWGQAMYVFEAERGLHPIISCKASSADLLVNSGNGASEQLSLAVDAFLESQRDWIQAMTDVLPALLGVEQLAIEGYFDPIKKSRVIVDMDIPLDLAWNTV